MLGTKWVFFSPPLTWLMSRIFCYWSIPAVLGPWLNTALFFFDLATPFLEGEGFSGSSVSNLSPSLLLIFWGLALRLIIFSHFSHIRPNGCRSTSGLHYHLHAGDSPTCSLSGGLPYPAFPLISPPDVSEALQNSQCPDPTVWSSSPATAPLQLHYQFCIRWVRDLEIIFNSCLFLYSMSNLLACLFYLISQLLLKSFYLDPSPDLGTGPGIIRHSMNIWWINESPPMTL